MNNKVVLVTAVIASILVVGMISPIGPVFAHVNVCSSSNDNDGTPFLGLWAAVCDLQSQVDSLQNQINNLHGGGGTQSNINAKFVKLTPMLTCASTTPLGIPVGWCPSVSSSYFLIQDSAVGPKSVIQTSTVNPTTPVDAVYCPVQSINYTETRISGFLILCNTNVDPNTELNYVILNPAITTTPPLTCTPPQVLQNGICVTPQPVCTLPQVLDKTTNTCITPSTHDDDKDKKQGNDSQFSNYKNENKH